MQIILKTAVLYSISKADSEVGLRGIMGSLPYLIDLTGQSVSLAGNMVESPSNYTSRGHRGRRRPAMCRAKQNVLNPLFAEVLKNGDFFAAFPGSYARTRDCQNIVAIQDAT